jgi:hypothetical protein
MKFLNIFVISTFLAAATAFAEDTTTANHGFVQGATHNTVSVDHLIGSSVRSRTENDEIGDLKDILIDANGRPVAAIISVGGFLGIGQRDVAVSWDRVSVVPENEDGTAMRADGTAATKAQRQSDRSSTSGQMHKPDSYILVVDVTEEALKNAPEFDRSWD